MLWLCICCHATLLAALPGAEELSEEEEETVASIEGKGEEEAEGGAAAEGAARAGCAGAPAQMLVAAGR